MALFELWLQQNTSSDMACFGYSTSSSSRRLSISERFMTPSLASAIIRDADFRRMNWPAGSHATKAARTDSLICRSSLPTAHVLDSNEGSVANREFGAATSALQRPSRKRQREGYRALS